MACTRASALIAAFILLGILPPAATAQEVVMNLDHRWSIDVGLGWDNGISGDINSGAIGTLNDQVVVILPNPYDKVYGTGFHLRFGAGYLLDDITEVRGVFTYQSLDAELVPMGDIGISRLYGQYDKYKTLSLDAGLRRYFGFAETVKAYAEGTVGIGFISEIDVVLSAPAANFTERATDFYDRTAAFALGGNAGLLFQVTDGMGVYGQLGLRWMSGLSAIDDLGGGLESINDDSSRWTMPIVIGLRAQF